MAFITTIPPNFGKAETPGDGKINGNTVLKELQAAALLLASPLIVAQVGRASAGALTLTGVKVGDIVSGVANLTVPGDAKASFESVITVAGQIQQITGTSTNVLQFIIIRQS